MSKYLIIGLVYGVVFFLSLRISQFLTGFVSQQKKTKKQRRWSSLIPAFHRYWQRKKMVAQLPDTLDMIGNAMQAGLSLVQAMDVAAQEAEGALGPELKKVNQDIRFGLSIEEALTRMQARWGNPDFELFVIAAGVSLQTGGNLAEVIKQITTTIRERRRLQGRIESLTAQGKLSGWVVGLLPFFLFMTLLGLEPELMGGFIRHPIGLVLLAACLLLETLGAWFIIKIVKITI